MLSLRHIRGDIRSNLHFCNIVRNVRHCQIARRSIELLHRLSCIGERLSVMTSGSLCCCLRLLHFLLCLLSLTLSFFLLRLQLCCCLLCLLSCFCSLHFSF